MEVELDELPQKYCNKEEKIESLHIVLARAISFLIFSRKEKIYYKIIYMMN